MDYLQKIIGEFEIHSVDGISKCFENGVDPNQMHNGKPLLYELLNMYTRGPKFKDCVQAFVDYGLRFDDRVLLAVLLDDATTLDRLLIDDPELVSTHYSLDSTFTPLKEWIFHSKFTSISAQSLPPEGRC